MGLARPKCFVQGGSLISFVSFGTANEGGGTRRAKNATPWRFLYALSSPFGQKNTSTAKAVLVFLARPKGLEPLTS